MNKLKWEILKNNIRFGIIRLAMKLTGFRAIIINCHFAECTVQGLDASGISDCYVQATPFRTFDQAQRPMLVKPLSE